MKPVNPLFQMCAEYFQEGGLGEVILGITFMAIFGPQISLDWSFNVVFPIVIGAAFSPLIYFAIKLWTMAFFEKILDLGVVRTDRFVLFLQTVVIGNGHDAKCEPKDENDTAESNTADQELPTSQFHLNTPFSHYKCVR